MQSHRLEVIERLAVDWPVQCFDADYAYTETGVGNMVHQGEGPPGDRSYDNMAIKIDGDTIVLTHDHDPEFMEGEYRNAFTLSNAFTLPESDDEFLVLAGQFRAEALQGSCGAWFHLDELFTDEGVITSGLGGFKGGATGLGVTGERTDEMLRGWGMTIVDADAGWGPIDDGRFEDPELGDGVRFEVRVNRSATHFAVNGRVFASGPCAFKWEAAPKIVIQLWLDNFAVHLDDSGSTFLTYEDTSTKQIVTYNGIEVLLARQLT